MGLRIRGLSVATKGHFTRRGIAKLPFDTKAEAVEWGKRWHQEPYRCTFCGRWHVASKAKP